MSKETLKLRKQRVTLRMLGIRKFLDSKALDFDLTDLTPKCIGFEIRSRRDLGPIVEEIYERWNDIESAQIIQGRDGSGVRTLWISLLMDDF